MGKPTVKEIEEYMAALNLPEQQPRNQSIEEWKAGLVALAEKGSNGTTSSDFNVISKPKHYMLFEEEGIEVRDVLEKLVSKIRAKPAMTGLFESDYVQLMQYLMRFMDKNGKEDLEKARWYLDKMIEAY